MSRSNDNKAYETSPSDYLISTPLEVLLDAMEVASYLTTRDGFLCFRVQVLGFSGFRLLGFSV